MIVYRICNAKYSNDLSGTGAKLMGARWNSKGIAVLYTSQHISLSVLEMLVNTNFKDYKIALDLLYINIPEHIKVLTVEAKSLKDNWMSDFEYTRYIVDEILTQKQTAVIKVPSAVINEEYNYLINPMHNDFKKIKLLKIKSFLPDQRLFSI